MQKNLVYTGITRGKRLVVLVGQRRALAIALGGGQAKRRWSKLREWLATSLEMRAAAVSATAGETEKPDRA